MARRISTAPLGRQAPGLRKGACNPLLRLNLPYLGKPRAGGQAVGTDVVTRFDKLRIDPASLKVDIGDTTFAVSEGKLVHTSGAEITSMPLGVAMSCGGGYATANINIFDTPFELDERYTIAGAGMHSFSTPLWYRCFSVNSENVRS